MDTPATTNGRDDGGRFAEGNRGGPGRPRGFREELVRAASDAVEPQHVTAIMRRAVRMALEGNLSAMRFVIERTCGRAADAPTAPMPLDVSLPSLRTAASCATAIDKITAAVTAGTIDLATAKALTDIVCARMKAIEVNDLEERLAELEKQASTVDFGAR